MRALHTLYCWPTAQQFSDTRENVQLNRVSFRRRASEFRRRATARRHRVAKMTYWIRCVSESLVGLLPGRSWLRSQEGLPREGQATPHSLNPFQHPTHYTLNGSAPYGIDKIEVIFTNSFASLYSAAPSPVADGASIPCTVHTNLPWPFAYHRRETHLNSATMRIPWSLLSRGETVTEPP